MFGWFCILALTANLLIAQEAAQKEAVLGARLAGQVRSGTSAIADPMVNDYVEGLARRLAALLPGAGNLGWEFAVVRDDAGGSTHEPLSVPGGHIFVPASLILAANNEAELAGMLAHSMAHTTDRRGQVTNSATVPLAFVGGWAEIGPTGSDDRAAVPMGYLEIQRRKELAADLIAVNTIAGAGYDPRALVEYIRRTQRVLSVEARKYSALPAREDRISALEVAVANLPSRMGPTGEEFEAVRNSVRKLTGSPAKQPPSLQSKGGK